jgi:hypothetical protein
MYWEDGKWPGEAEMGKTEFTPQILKHVFQYYLGNDHGMPTRTLIDG